MEDGRVLMDNRYNRLRFRGGSWFRVSGAPLWSLTDYQQEVGQASRDGAHGLCLSITSSDLVQRHLPREKFSSSQVSELFNFLFDTTICRVKYLGDSFDGIGKGIKCDPRRRELCDNCKSAF